MKRGYFEIGIFRGKTSYNIGTLWRSAFQLGANGIFTVGARYPRQASDTVLAYRYVPMREYINFEDFYQHLPYDCRLVGIEMGGKPLSGFAHPERAIYILGAEDDGLPKKVIEKCHYVISLEAKRTESYNVAVAGSLVMYDRMYK